jgi:UDP-N-acetylmuramate dehydrogenase
VQTGVYEHILYQAAEERMNEIEKKILHSVPLAPYTTFKIGGPARYFIMPSTTAQYREALEWARVKKIPFFVMGGGANVLVHDSGYSGLVINTGNLNRITVKERALYAECGVSVDSVVDESVRHALSGLEFAAGLPGTVGGALFMNARAYEGEFSRIVYQVFALEMAPDRVVERVLKKNELNFSYKKSVFQEKRLFVSTVHLALHAEKKTSIQLRVEKIRKKRIDAGQYLFPNAGCIFKNDYRIGRSAGAVLDGLGLKGKRIGDAEVYTKHANFIINRGNARAADVFRLMRILEDEVLNKTGIRLEREIVLLGDWDDN